MKTILTFILSLAFIVAIADERKENNKPYPPQALNPTITVGELGVAGLTPDMLVASLVGPGVTYSNVSYTGTQGAGTASGGNFSGGQTIFGIDEGVMLCSGRVLNSLGPNDSDGISTGLGLPGDADLNAAFGGINTYDATVLEFDFVPTGSEIFVEYVFASDEYNEYANSYSDAFAFFLNGVNIAKITGTNIPVSCGSVNLGSYSQFYKNNDRTDFGVNCPYDIEADGMTTKFTASGPVNLNVSNHIKLVIADKNDSALDSWVFLHGGTFSTVNPNIPTLSQWGLIILGLTLLGFGTFYIMRMRG